MKPAEYPVGHYLEDNLQIHVPPYQRPYSWESDRHVDLWRDIANEYRKEGKGGSGSHFMGAVILEKMNSSSTTGVTSVIVIDGQQRILTLITLLASIRDAISYPAGKVSKSDELAWIKPKFGRPTPRVVAKAQDQPVVNAILGGEFVKVIAEDLFDHPLAQAYRFFRYQLWQGKPAIQQHSLLLPPRPARGKSAPPRGTYDAWGKPAVGAKAIDLPILPTVITSKLNLLELMLEASDEEAGVVFETMNAKGTPLRQFDLLRNSIFVRMPQLKDPFYIDIWQYVEEDLQQVTYSSLRDKPQDQFFYEYLISTGEAGISKDSMHRRWLSGVIEDVGYAVTKASEVKFEERHVMPLSRAAFLYPMAVGQKRLNLDPSTGITRKLTEPNLATIREIMAASGGPVVPIMLRALFEQSMGNLTDLDISRILQDLQSYLVRAMLAAEDLSPLRGAMMQVAARLPSPLTVGALRDALRDADWKTDAQVLASVTSMDTHSWSSAALFPILRGIERQLSGISAHPMPFGSAINQFSVEHVYPQTPNIGAKWDADLKMWGVLRDDIDARRYVLGNLTAVTGYDNRVNGKRPFGEKQSLIASTAPLKLHDSIIRGQKWTPARIDRRTDLLARAALKRWPRR